MSLTSPKLSLGFDRGLSKLMPSIHPKWQKKRDLKQIAQKLFCTPDSEVPKPPRAYRKASGETEPQIRSTVALRTGPTTLAEPRASSLRCCERRPTHTAKRSSRLYSSALTKSHRVMHTATSLLFPALPASRALPSRATPASCWESLRSRSNAGVAIDRNETKASACVLE